MNPSSFTFSPFSPIPEHTKKSQTVATKVFESSNKCQNVQFIPPGVHGIKYRIPSSISSQMLQLNSNSISNSASTQEAQLSSTSIPSSISTQIPQFSSTSNSIPFPTSQFSSTSNSLPIPTSQSQQPQQQPQQQSTHLESIQYPMQFLEDFNKFVNNDLQVRRKFNIKIKTLITDYPTIFRPFKGKTGISIYETSEEQAKGLLIQFYDSQKNTIKPKDIIEIEGVKEIMEDSTTDNNQKALTISALLEEQHIEGITTEQIKQLIYRLGIKPKTKHPLDDYVNILSNPNLSIPEKIEAVNSSVQGNEFTDKDIRNYINRHKYQSKKSFNLLRQIITEDMIKNKDIDEILAISQDNGLCFTKEQIKQFISRELKKQN